MNFKTKSPSSCQTSTTLFERSQSFASSNLQISGEVAVSDPYWAPESLEFQTRAFLRCPRPVGRHSTICACVNAYSLYKVLSLHSVMTTASDCNEKFHSEVDLKQERERTRQRKREDVRSGERLQRRTQRKRQLRTVESADDRLERLQRRRQHERQLRTVDRESADDRPTSATEKTTPALSEYHRVSRWQARTSATEKITRGSD